MKKILLNKELSALRLSSFVEENKEIMKEKMGLELFCFIQDYPFVCTYPEEELIPNKTCECCKQTITNSHYWYKWEEGFRPKLENINISLSKICDCINISNSNSGELSKECKEVVERFKKISWQNN